MKIKKLIFNSIKIYQLFFSPYLGRVCRFYPSCSEYYYLATDKHGILKGFLMGAGRILKCHPWHRGGVDIP